MRWVSEHGWAGSIYGWRSGHALGPLIVGIAVSILFGVYEWKGTKTGLLNHGLFKNRNFALSAGILIAEGVCYATVQNFRLRG